MADAEKDFGGVVAGTRAPLRRVTRKPMSMAKRNPAIEAGAEEEQTPGTPLPDRTVKAMPEQFGQFAQQKRK